VVDMVVSYSQACETDLPSERKDSQLLQRLQHSIE
jgi:hypothetical protein